MGRDNDEQAYEPLTNSDNGSSDFVHQRGNEGSLSYLRLRNQRSRGWIAIVLEAALVVSSLVYGTFAFVWALLQEPGVNPSCPIDPFFRPGMLDSFKCFL